jgi:hypothetical protein
MDATMLGKFYWVSSIGRGEGKGYGFQNFYYRGTSSAEKGEVRIYDDGNNGQILITKEGVMIGGAGKYALVELVVAQGGYVLQIENITQPHVSGAALITENIALYIPPEGVESLFVKMFLLDGAGLKKFEKIYDNGMVKTFELKSNE